jgi:hypothetical protein
MSDTDKSARPRQLTMAAGFVIGGSVLLVLTVFDRLSSLQSVDTRDRVAKTLSSPPLDGMGISVTDWLAGQRVGLMIAAACAMAAAVLGIYVLQRHRGARLALSILAVPLLLSTIFPGGLLGTLVAVSILMLWSGQARDWFAGRPVRQLEPAARESGSGRSGASAASSPWETTLPPADRRTPEEPPATPEAPQDTTPDSGEESGPRTPPASSLSTTSSSTQPLATSGFGQRAADPHVHQDTGWVPPPYAAVVRGAAVPLTVKIACILTWVFAGVVALAYLGVMVALVVAKDQMVDYVVKVPEWQRANFDQDVILPVLWVGCLMFLAWSVGACLLAWFTWRRHNWARWLLVASAAATLVAALFAFPVGILHQLAAALTVGGLLGTAPREWFADRRPPGPPPSGGWTPTQPGPQQGQYPAQQYPPQQWPGQDQAPPNGPPAGPPPGGKPPVW